MNTCVLCKRRTLSKNLCPTCQGVAPKRAYTKISLPGMERQTTAQAASCAIQAGPLQQSGIGSRQNPYSTIRQKDLHRTTPCRSCGKFANVESVCFSMITGKAVQLVRCPHPGCRAVEDRLQ